LNSGSTKGLSGLILNCGKKKSRGSFKKIRNEPSLSEHEKHLFARSLAATPDERWRLHENFLRSHDLFTRSARKKIRFQIAGMSARHPPGRSGNDSDTDLLD